MSSPSQPGGLVTSSRRKAGLFADRIQQMVPTTFAYCSLVVVGALFEATSVEVRSVLDAVGIAVGAMALVVWGQWLINDVYDKETDKESNPDRATTRGDITDREALLVGSVLVLVGLAGTWTVGPYAAASLFAYVVVNTAYSIPPLRTKAGGVSSMVTLGTMGGCSVLLGGATVANEITPLAAKLSVIVLAFMAVNMSYKDLKDADHDAESGVENFAVRFGADTVRRVSMAVLPTSYLVVALYFGLYGALPLFVGFAAYVFYLLYTWDGGNELVYKLDGVNAAFLLSLGVSYYVLYS